MLRLATAGSVDDGKSTLIGRLLYDTKALFEDQLEAVGRASRDADQMDLALFTDGLRAEREQGITIDVAYRYFVTPQRKFIIADTPGHVQYTRNMVTGASTADLAVILIDASKGLVEQGRRHTFLVSLLRVPHVVIAVNKMDLVDFDLQIFARISDEFARFAARLALPDLTMIPISALHGDNVVDRSDRMRWYEGPSLLQHLEYVHIASDRNLIDVRFPVQYVIRSDTSGRHGYRRYAGQVASGVLRVGDPVVVMPCGMRTHIAAIEAFGDPLTEAFPPMSVALRLADDLDVSRGDMICRSLSRPAVTQCVETLVCWMDERQPLTVGRRLILKHTTRTVPALAEDLRYRLDVNTGHRDVAARSLACNEIGRVQLRTTQPLLFDEYSRNRTTGAFILIDEWTNATVAAGMIIATR
jgi:bifunctional enzyme CysN/CysC